jgi:hypothetical protein
MYASILVALSLVLSPAPGVCRSAPAQPEAAAPPLLPPEPGPRPQPKQPERKKLDSVAAVAIDVSAAGGEGPVLDQRVRGKTEAELTALHIMQGQGADIPQVVIKLTELGGDEIGWSYTIDINHADQVPIPGGSFRGECKDCTENELVDRVAGDVRSLLPRLRAYIVDYNAKIDAENARNQQTHPTPVEDKNKGVEPGPRVGPSDAGAFNPLCKVGIGMMAVGVVGIGAGVTMAVMPDRYGDACGSPDADPLACTEGKSTKLPGYVALGLGGALAIAGVALFVVGNRQSKQPRTALVPAFGGGMLGLRWSARF